MKEIVPYFYIENCKENLAFYKDIFGGEVVSMPYPENPEKVMHAKLQINERCILYFADDIFGNIHPHGTIHLEMESEEEIDKLFAALAEGGMIQMPLEVQVWGAKYGALKDRNGLLWGFNYQSPQ